MYSPGSAVATVTAKDEAGFPVNVDVDIEPFVRHLHIKIRSSVVLAEMDARRVTLQNFLNHFGHRTGIAVCSSVAPLDPFVIEREPSLNWHIEYAITLGRHLRVILYVLQHPPRRVTRVVSWRADRAAEYVSL